MPEVASHPSIQAACVAVLDFIQHVERLDDPKTRTIISHELKAGVMDARMMSMRLLERPLQDLNPADVTPAVARAILKSDDLTGRQLGLVFEFLRINHGSRPKGHFVREFRGSATTINNLIYSESLVDSEHGPSRSLILDLEEKLEAVERLNDLEREAISPSADLPMDHEYLTPASELEKALRNDVESAGLVARNFEERVLTTRIALGSLAAGSSLEPLAYHQLTPHLAKSLLSVRPLTGKLLSLVGDFILFRRGRGETWANMETFLGEEPKSMRRLTRRRKINLQDSPRAKGCGDLIQKLNVLLDEMIVSPE